MCFRLVSALVAVGCSLRKLEASKSRFVVQGRRKIKKAGDATPSAFEENCAQELYNIEMQHSGLKTDLYPLHITAAREITTDGKKAVVLFVPYTQLADYHKIQKTLIEELEKKFA